jgi:mannose-6-phosphate isomerase
MKEAKTNTYPIFYSLIPSIQYYDWGNRSENSFIKDFLKKKKKLEFDINQPIAELWKGAHKKAPSKLTPYPLKYLEQDPEILLEQEKNLDDLIKQNPEHFLGSALVNKNIHQLPFLFKILDVEKPLSIQAHPDKKLAEILHKRDPKNYPDDNHKPELAISLGNFEAIVGFRPLEEILRFIHTYPINKYLGIENFSDVDIIKNIYKKIMLLNPMEIEFIVKDIIHFLNTNSPEPIRDKWFFELIKHYGDKDPGLFSIYLFNYFNLKKGEGIFLGPNIPHAYLKGEILECMADSDNVVRGGLTSKYKDIEVLISMLDYNAQDIKPITPFNFKNLYKYYPIPVDDFIVKLLHEPSSEQFSKSIVLEDFPSILIILAGNIKINIREEKTLKEQKDIEEGEILFFPGDLKERNLEIQIEFDDDSWVFLASTNL